MSRGIYKRKPVIERFLPKFKKTKSCWVWTRSQTRGGYGAFNDGQKIVAAHIWSYKHFVGPIPKHLELDHLCRTPLCVNPMHLEAVTHRENVLRGNGFSGLNARKTHCIHGHEFNHSNTYIRKNTKNKERMCKKCNYLSTKILRQRKLEPMWQ